jgi:SAM-dependent methyltransferase
VVSETGSRYLHGTHPEEQRRLSQLNDLLNVPSLRELGLTGGERVLDVGSGLGQFSRALARAVGPAGRVVGVERSAEQLAEAARQAAAAGEADLVDFRPGEATRLPLAPEEWGTFDLAHTRFLLEHVPDPLAVVREMVRAVRPGGRVVLADDDHDLLRFWPEPPGVWPLWHAYFRTYDRNGNDPHVGRRLVSLLHEAGAVPARNTWIFFGGCAGQPAFPALIRVFIGVFVGAREAILGAGLFDAAYFEAALAALEAWGQRPEAALWYGICWAEGVRPA